MQDKNLVKQRIADTLEQNYMPYVMSVILSRAIPEIDGFKPSHRKLLYTMYKMGLLKGNRTKSANVVGQTMKLNPHGDMAIYETLVRLTSGHDALIHPYIDSKGNFGKASSRDMKFAASRYTEVKLEAICQEIFANIDKDTVDFVDNYDATMQEPTLFPTTFPNVLVNANKGIAVGMASSIASFNLREVCRLTIAKLKGEPARPEDFLTGPDFSTGGYLLYDEKTLASIYQTGQGTIRLRAKYQYDAKNKLIEITEIPYSTTVEAIIDKIVDAIKNNKAKEVSDVRDETDLKGLKITLDLKRGTDPDVLMQKLFKITPLEDSFSCNFNLLVNGRPAVLGVDAILEAWIDFRLGSLVRQLNFELKGLNDRLHLLLGLHKVLLDIDKAIRIIRDTADDEAVIPNLMAAFKIDEVQANYVAEIKLRNLNKNYLIKRIDDIENLKTKIADIEQTLGSKRRQKTLIVKDLQRVIDKYGQDRKTIIIKDAPEASFTSEDLIEDYNIKVFLTDHGYFKKISLTSLRAYSEHKIKDDDKILQELESTNLSDIIFFTDRFNAYKMKAHEFDDHKASELGTYLANVLDLEPDESVIYIHSTLDYKGWFTFGFKNGKIAKVPVSSYETKTNRKKLVNAYSDKSPLIAMHYLTEERNMYLVRSEKDGSKNMVVFNTALVNEKVTRNTQGVQVIRLKKGTWASAYGIPESLKIKKTAEYISESIPVAGTKLSVEDNLKNPQL